MATSDVVTSAEGVYRVREKPVEGLNVATGGPVTQQFLETIEYNNNLINDLSLEVKVANVNGELDKKGLNNPRHKGKHKGSVDQDVVIWCDITKMNFSDAGTITTTGGFPAYKGFRIDFPSNISGDFFHDQYLPVCLLQLMTTPGVNFPKMALAMTRIATNFVKFDIQLLTDNGEIHGPTDLWVQVFAMGRKGDYYDDLTEELKTPHTVQAIST